MLTGPEAFCYCADGPLNFQSFSLSSSHLTEVQLVRLFRRGNKWDLCVCSVLVNSKTESRRSRSPYLLSVINLMIAYVYTHKAGVYVDYQCIISLLY
jgi:hypothetical protein